ncbi:N-acetyltransferase [Glutamicibacter sp. JL.03c]|uniref:N-acetyltransferase n=1 Tax=Glutamicibacter sp. JL.03c TaxID=2984842 RepID=UPI0021F765A1|nr:N-acetyltransferase [Glutamicibacter sp. JL.03c]UYQ77420.1 N-acetyltransferase [Glutamicibacter sp. JL.03c]
MARNFAPGITLEDFDPSSHPEQLGHLAPPGEAWERDLSASNAQILAMRSAEGAIDGCALLTARSAGAYLKISSVLGRTTEHLGQVVQAVLDHARQQGLACVKWEIRLGHPDLQDLAQNLGFERLPAPRRSAHRTGRASAAGFVQWLAPARYLRNPHYQQTENFTCAAVAALTAHQETSRIQSLGELRVAELMLWREATNFMACEPIELGLAVARRWPRSPVRVWLDTREPVMVDYYSEADRDWRAVLQRQSRLQADTAGLDLRTERLAMPQIVEALAGGAQVLLLVSLERMLGFDVPHWVLCHGIAGTAERPVVVIEDSWVNDSSAESWVDATCLPIAAQELDSMSVLEDGRYRAALVLG